LIYYGSKLSENLIENSETGYLVALNVPISRTGAQKYKPSEIPMEGIADYTGPDGLVSVYREPDDVFDPVSIASFEGMPSTDGHPQGNMVNSSNEAYLRKGHMQNVRRGTGEYADNLVADIFITDPMLKDAIKNKTKRGISCGYMCDWVPENGKVFQRNIRGNHVAVVPKGRAGSDVCINDEQPPEAGERRKFMAKDSKTLFQRIFGMGLKEYAKDALPEEMAEAAKLGEPAHDEPPAGGGLAEVLTAIQGIDARLQALEKSDEKVHATLPGNAMDELDKEIAAEAKKEDEPVKEEKEEKSTAVDDDTLPVSGAADSASSIDFVKRMKPIVAKMPAGPARDEAISELRAIVKGGKAPAGSVYGEIKKAAQSHQVHDEKPAQTTADRAQAFADNCAKLAKEGK
jgi:hypothetical protein